MMAILKKIWVNEYQKFDKPFKEIRIVWDNDRHQAVEISGNRPADLLHALERAHSLIVSEMKQGEI